MGLGLGLAGGGGSSGVVAVAAEVADTGCDPRVDPGFTIREFGTARPCDLFLKHKLIGKDPNSALDEYFGI